MKRIFTCLLVLAMCAPAMAASVAFVNHGNGTGTFTITATEFMVGLGLDVDATGGAVTAVAVPAAFNIYPDAAFTMETGTPGSYTYGAGGPVCDKLVPGVASLPSSSFALCFANLNGASTPGADGAQVVAITFTVSANNTQVCIAENAIRGGVIGTLGEDVALTGTLCGTITSGPPPVTCQDYNMTKLVSGGTDNAVNVSDLNNLIGWVNANKTGTIFTVTSTNPNWLPNGPLYNMTKKLGGTDNAVNVSDLNAIITFVNTWKTGTIFTVNCLTCGC